ncbi:MAG: hypothetical protein ACR2P6_08770, partial [Gammaproteobacteria bacterium]
MCRAGAAELEHLDVRKKSGRIFVDAIIHIDAPRAFVFGVLTNYDELADLSDRFTESRLLSPDTDGRQRVKTTVEGCVWFFCRAITRVAWLETSPVHEIV